MGVRWPEEHAPANTAVFVSNQLEMNVPPAAVWEWLIRADLWPEWYPNSKNVTYLEPSKGPLRLGTTFRWTTFGVTIVSRVEEFSLGERIAWNARGTGVDAYHAWLIEKTDNGCRVLNRRNAEWVGSAVGEIADAIADGKIPPDMAGGTGATGARWSSPAGCVAAIAGRVET
jgi:Polyketide cyclase / dehydrase and lipid transport